MDRLLNQKFAPETLFNYKVFTSWATISDEHHKLWPLHRLHQRGQNSHAIVGVVDFNGEPVDIEFGAGFGVTTATDPFTLNLILSKDL